MNAATTQFAVQIDRLTVERNNTRIVNDVSLNIPTASCTVLLGPNGSGKTTLIRSIAGLTDHGGSIHLFDTAISSIKTREQSRIRAYAPQEPLFPAGMSVLQYVALGNPQRNREATNTAIALCGLSELQSRDVGSLSGGEKRRACLAQALAQNTPLVLLDEPTTALDIGHQQSLLALIEKIRHELGTTFILAMHDLTLAGQYATHVGLLSKGRLVEFGSSSDVLRVDLLEQNFGTPLAVLSDDSTRAIVPRRANS